MNKPEIRVPVLPPPEMRPLTTPGGRVPLKPKSCRRSTTWGGKRTVDTIGFLSEISYDSLIVATGATQSYFGHPAFERDAPGIKTIDHALELRGRIFGAFEMAERARRATGGAPIRLGLDAVSGDACKRIGDCIAEGGIVVSYGSMSGQDPTMSRAAVNMRGVNLTGFNLGRGLAKRTREQVRAIYADLAEKLRSEGHKVANNRLRWLAAVSGLETGQTAYIRRGRW